MKPDTYSFDTNFNCNINNEEGVNRFVDYYMKETNETIKLKYKNIQKQRIDVIMIHETKGKGSLMLY